MDLNLQIKPRSEDALLASYSCPCGCNPRVPYQRDADATVDGCCCGNTFAVGDHAADKLQLADGFVLETQAFAAPWGQPLQAAWAIGPSTDPNAGHGHDHGADGHGHAHGEADAASSATTAIDPVCGMTVDIAAARAKDLHTTHLGRDYYFCGRGCKLEFGDDPQKYLDPSYVPSM